MRYCECGCGQPTPVAKRTNTCWGHVKGEPLRFINGHNRKAPPSTPYAKRARYTPVMAGMDTPCYEPRLARGTTGYCLVQEGPRTLGAHVAMWEAKHGPVPEGLELDHLCRNRWCINVDHLEPVTRAVNVQRGKSAKLTPAAVREIRASDESLKELSQRFGVTMANVSLVRLGLTWRNVA